MNYAKSYLKTRGLADMIRESAASGKVEKAGGGGLAARTERRQEFLEKPDFETIRATYMNVVQDMFKENIQKRIDSVTDESLMDELTGPSVLGEAIRPARNPKNFAKNYPEMSERDILAMTIQAEAGGEGYDGMLAVGAVMDNRLKSGKFGGTFKDVALAPGQFSAWNSLTGYAKGEGGIDMSRVKPSEDAYAVADEILSGKYSNPVGGATHYYNPNVADPKWGQKSGGNWTPLGNHVFGSVR